LTDLSTPPNQSPMASGSFRPIYIPLIILLLYLVLEIIAFTSLLLARKIRQVEYTPIDKKTVSGKSRLQLEAYLAGKKSYLVPDSVLGWDIAPNRTHGPYTSNNQAIRASINYSKEPNPGLSRTLLYGDSYTHGDEVQNNQTWAYLLDSLLTNQEVINFGVPGYAPDQALLKYQRTSQQFKAQHIVLGFMPENIHRIVSVYRPFYSPHTGLPFVKPVFTFSQGKLIFIPPPYTTKQEYQKLLSEGFNKNAAWLDYDYHYHYRYGESLMDWSPLYRSSTLLVHGLTKNHYIKPNGMYNTQHWVYQLLLELFKDYYRLVKAQNQTFTLLILPSLYDLQQISANKPARYQTLLQDLDSLKIPYYSLDTLFALTLRTSTISELHHGHYSPLGNKVVAHHLAQIWSQP